MSALRTAIDAEIEEGRKAMGIFVTSGFPEKESTLDILLTIAQNGADFVELGMPFSDPLAEGTPIQKSSERALSNGIKMAETLEFARGFSKASNVPLLLMGYVNPLMRFGLSNFCEAARSSGVKGLIIPDLPPEESQELAQLCKLNELDLIHLIAPNTSDERIKNIDLVSSGFVYAVSITGLTGSALNSSSKIADYLKASKLKVTKNRLLVGFGINSHEWAMSISEPVDGFIVGSAVIQKLESLWDDASLAHEEKLKELGSFIKDLKHGRPHES